MSLQLPAELASLLGELGYTWPESDEERLMTLGQEWLAFAELVDDVLLEADIVARQVANDHTALSIDSFLAAWQAEESGASTLARGSAGAAAVGGGLTLCAGVVLALKVSVVIQLTLLAVQIIQAIATAAPTLGVSLIQVPVFKKLTGLAIDFVVNEATEAIIG
jgi:hypothetical protein